ncbi:hypothetical protein POSPLADRAFT_1046990 [Postia placenta MAD-698-R-SB12]|uniref:Citrate transporter-like domain-containing protein n=1 Tax=Postia placenta MAD-698-R-SB12 TaxID=670580 RepID=A0A1X6MZC6_9APHY|nr:hypothetical protein POSPLADRAFT_1046990 [Postia placenta MAD-698-R-SB12]OSX61707.1 hypothetical protein POSPLADRAFT_1046990 [Postia placenta MAD-698-R-SB12]
MTADVGRWQSVLCLIFFTYLHLNFITVPLLSVLILLATGAINGTVIRDGIVGANGVKPLDIMALFISLAYLSISLDATGLLRFLAFKVVQKGGSSGRKLYAYLYIFFLICGAIVGNDPVILSGTAFLAYMTRVSGSLSISNPTAWIFAQFAAANMASVVLVSSNPTNLVLSGAFALSFTTYTAHSILPFLGAAALVYPVLVFLFRSTDLVPRAIDVDADNDVGAALVDKQGAVVGSALLLVTLGVLVGTSTIGVPVWEVTVPPAVLMLLRDIHHDWSRGRTVVASRRRSVPPDSASNDATSVRNQLELREIPSQPSMPEPCRSPAQSITLQAVFDRSRTRLSSSFPTVAAIAQRLPIPLLPFAFLMFILVQGLSAHGWVEVLASWWGAWARKTGVMGAIGGMGFVACMFCNVCGTNIGATILLARVLQVWIVSQPGLDRRAREGAIYALALGSNYGAFTLTFSASLAGLLWRSILQQKGIRVRPRQFLMLNLPIAITAMTASSAVLLAQVYVTRGR